MMSGPLKALLGVLAVAGYQNRDKIADLPRSIQNQPGSPAPQSDSQGQHTGGLGGLFSGPSGFGDLLGGLTTSGILSGGLGDLLKTFQQNGQPIRLNRGSTPAPTRRSIAVSFPRLSAQTS